MAKRVRDTLTGGTGDVSPQYLTGSIIQSGANALTQQQLGAPINRLQGAGNGSTTIMEILKVYARFSGTDCTFFL